MRVGWHRTTFCCAPLLFLCFPPFQREARASGLKPALYQSMERRSRDPKLRPYAKGLGGGRRSLDVFDDVGSWSPTMLDMLGQLVCEWIDRSVLRWISFYWVGRQVLSVRGAIIRQALQNSVSLLHEKSSGRFLQVLSLCSFCNSVAMLLPFSFFCDLPFWWVIPQDSF